MAYTLVVAGARHSWRRSFTNPQPLVEALSLPSRFPRDARKSLRDTTSPRGVRRAVILSPSTPRRFVRKSSRGAATPVQPPVAPPFAARCAAGPVPPSRSFATNVHPLRRGSRCYADATRGAAARQPQLAGYASPFATTGNLVGNARGAPSRPPDVVVTSTACRRAVDHAAPCSGAFRCRRRRIMRMMPQMDVSSALQGRRLRLRPVGIVG